MVETKSYGEIVTWSLPFGSGLPQVAVALADAPLPDPARRAPVTAMTAMLATCRFMGSVLLSPLRTVATEHEKPVRVLQEVRAAPNFVEFLLLHDKKVSEVVGGLAHSARSGVTQLCTRRPKASPSCALDVKTVSRRK